MVRCLRHQVVRAGKPPAQPMVAERLGIQRTTSGMAVVARRAAMTAALPSWAAAVAAETAEPAVRACTAAQVVRVDLQARRRAAAAAAITSRQAPALAVKLG